MLVTVDGSEIDPACLRTAEHGFNQERFRGAHAVVARLRDDELLTLIGEDYDELSRELEADVAKVGANELEWLCDIGFPPLVDVLRRAPDRLCALLEVYYGDSIWRLLGAHAGAPRYLVTTMDEVTREPGHYIFHGMARDMPSGGPQLQYPNSVGTPPSE
jgi:hypothetical protein